jgi:hypothetical protein
MRHARMQIENFQKSSEFPALSIQNDTSDHIPYQVISRSNSSTCPLHQNVTFWATCPKRSMPLRIEPARVACPALLDDQRCGCVV